MNFKNKVILVTGGAQGIGKAICQEFSSLGGRVIIADYEDTKGILLRDEIKDLGGDAIFIKVDFSKEEEIIEMSKIIYKNFGKLDILINCAAKGVIKGIDATKEEWYTVFDTNVLGYVFTIKHCLELLKSGEKSNIVNISSISGFIAQPGYLTYSMTKAAIMNMARCLAMDFAPFGIRVNNVCPGTIWTENNAFYISRDYNVDLEGANKHPEIGGKHLLKRVGFPEEVAKAVVFLASDNATFITGENLVVDGGYTVQ